MANEHSPLRIFLAGIMQGSHVAATLHEQDYRGQLRELLSGAFPAAAIYDPLAEHSTSLQYDEATGRAVFFNHNLMCREIDVLVAYVPTASMGTAIEMWEAYQHGAAVIAISPMQHNWAIRFLSHAVYPDIDALAVALRRGDVQRLLAEVLEASGQWPVVSEPGAMTNVESQMSNETPMTKPQ